MVGGDIREACEGRDKGQIHVFVFHAEMFKHRHETVVHGKKKKKGSSLQWKKLSCSITSTVASINSVMPSHHSQVKK
jgi:hypothetical protein